MPRKKSLRIHIDPDMDKWVRETSAERKISQSHLLRELIRESKEEAEDYEYLCESLGVPTSSNTQSVKFDEKKIATDTQFFLSMAQKVLPECALEELASGALSFLALVSGCRPFPTYNVGSWIIDIVLKTRASNEKTQ